MDKKELEELKRRCDADDPNALFEYAYVIADADPEESEKYYELAAQLGNPAAIQHVGEKYFEKGDNETAAYYFKAGAKAGIFDCSVKLAVINMPLHEQESVRELEELAEIGIVSACAALADYYKSRGNKKESAYWRSMVK